MFDLLFSIIFLQGTTIEGTLYEDLEASNQITMDEGDWFEIQNFKLIHASGLIRLSTNRYHIEMTNSSVISKIQPKIFGNYYRFTHFLNVLRGLSHPMYSIGIHVLFYII